MSAIEINASALITTAIIDDYRVADEVGRLVTTIVRIDGVDIELETYNRRGIEVYRGEETLGYYDDLARLDPKMSAKLHRAVQKHMGHLYH